LAYGFKKAKATSSQAKALAFRPSRDQKNPTNDYGAGYTYIDSVTDDSIPLTPFYDERVGTSNGN